MVEREVKSEPRQSIQQDVDYVDNDEEGTFSHQIDLDKLGEILTNRLAHPFFARGAASLSFEKAGLLSILHQAGIVPILDEESLVDPVTWVDFQAEVSETEAQSFIKVNDVNQRDWDELGRKQNEEKESLIYLSLGAIIGQVFGQQSGRQQIYPTKQFPTEWTPKLLIEYLQSEYSIPGVLLERHFQLEGLIPSLESGGILPLELEQRFKVVRYLHIGALLGRFIPELNLSSPWF